MVDPEAHADVATAIPAAQGVVTDVDELLVSEEEGPGDAIPEVDRVVGGLERAAPADAILATNSSSQPSRQIAERLARQTRMRVLNTHFYQPPTLNAVELILMFNLVLRG